MLKRTNLLMEKPLVQILKVFWLIPMLKVAEHDVNDEDLEIEHESKVGKTNAVLKLAKKRLERLPNLLNNP